MSTYTRSEITIATKEAVDNTFILKWFQNLPEDQQADIRNVILSDDKTHVDVCYHPALEMDELLANLSKEVSYTLVTVSHNYSNMSPFTVEYLTVFKNGDIIIDEALPYAVIDENNPFDDEGCPNFDQEASQEAFQHVKTVKAKWFTTFDINKEEDEVILTPDELERLLNSLFETAPADDSPC